MPFRYLFPAFLQSLYLLSQPDLRSASWTLSKLFELQWKNSSPHWQLPSDPCRCHLCSGAGVKADSLLDCQNDLANETELDKAAFKSVMRHELKLYVPALTSPLPPHLHHLQPYEPSFWFLFFRLSFLKLDLNLNENASIYLIGVHDHV